MKRECNFTIFSYSILDILWFISKKKKKRRRKLTFILQIKLEQAFPFDQPLHINIYYRNALQMW